MKFTDMFLGLFNFFRVDSGYGKEDQPQRTRRAQRVAVFSVSLCALSWFSEPIPEDNNKSHNSVTQTFKRRSFKMESGV